MRYLNIRILKPSLFMYSDAKCGWFYYTMDKIFKDVLFLVEEDSMMNFLDVI